MGRILSQPPPAEITGCRNSRRLERHCGKRANQESNDACLNQLRRLHMQYILMTYVQEDGWTRLTKADQQQGIAAYMAYSEALTRAGVLKGSNRLRPSSTATTV